MRMIPNEHLVKLKRREEARETMEKKVENPEEVEKPKEDEVYNRKKKKEKISVFPQEFNEIEGLLEQC